MLTSNLSILEGDTPGFRGPQSGPENARAALLRAGFRPDLVNHVDAVIPFRSLNPDDLGPITARLLANLRNRMRERGV